MPAGCARGPARCWPTGCDERCPRGSRAKRSGWVDRLCRPRRAQGGQPASRPPPAATLTERHHRSGEGRDGHACRGHRWRVRGARPPRGRAGPPGRQRCLPGRGGYRRPWPSSPAATTLARSTTDYRALIDDPTVDIVDICLPHDLHHSGGPRGLRGRQARHHRQAHRQHPRRGRRDDGRCGGRRDAASSWPSTSASCPSTSGSATCCPMGSSASPAWLSWSWPAASCLGCASRATGRARWDRAGGGALADSGTHVVDLAHLWFGPPVAVRCHLARHVVEAPDKADDTAGPDHGVPGPDGDDGAHVRGRGPALERDTRHLGRSRLPPRPTRGRRAPGRLEGRPGAFPRPSSTRPTGGPGR